MLKTLALLTPIFVNLIGSIFLVYGSDEKYKNRRFLALFMFNSVLLFIGHFMVFHDYVWPFRFYDFIFLASLLSFYPLYLLYVRSVFEVKVSLKYYWLHFLPGIICSTLSLLFSLMADRFTFVEYLNRTMDTSIGSSSWLSAALFYTYYWSRMIHIFQIVVYNVWILWYIRKNWQMLNEFFSNTDKIQPQYFFRITVSFLLLMALPGILVTIIGRVPFVEHAFMLPVTCLLFSIMYVIVGVHGMKQIPVASEVVDEDELSFVEVYPNTIEEVKDKLFSYFENEEPWRNTDLKIWDVAMALGTNRTYVSRVINEELGSNFNDFVKDYRMREAMRILKDDGQQQLALQTVAIMSGFGSMASFIRAFKQLTGKTPSSFRKENI
ncbi:helix-turn-helix domain-containing protein [Puteibacter caeruleilacunae]|nr:helix-turn-helix domain-containing protein [Puteibacter caeruleilacunae]